MITPFIGIWLQPRTQPAFSVCQLPASGLASTFYSMKLPLFFSCPSHSSPLVSSSPPFCYKFIFLYQLLPLLFLYVLWFPWELSSSRCMHFLLKQQKKAKTGTQTQTHTHTHYTHVCMRLFHVDYLGMSASGCNNFKYLFILFLIMCASSHRTSKTYCP